MDTTNLLSPVKTPLIVLKPVPKIPGLPAIASGQAIIEDKSITEPAALVEGLLHCCTKAVLASGSKAGKTWLLLLLALCVAIGRQFLRWKTKKGKVLFINLEIQPAFIKGRLHALMKRLGISECGDLHFWNLRGKFADCEALIAHIIKETEGKGYSLIIIDPYYKLMNGKSENMAGGVSMFCYHLERLAERSGACVVYSHHFAKGNAKKKTAMDRMSGSGVFARDADSIITLTEHTETDCYTVEMILRNFPHQASFVVQWEYPIFTEREDLDPEDVPTDVGHDDDTDCGVLALLEQGPLTSGDWQKQALKLGVSRPTFYRIKAALKEYIAFDRQTKTWALVNRTKVETRETTETVETSDPSVATPKV